MKLGPENTMTRNQITYTGIATVFIISATIFILAGDKSEIVQALSGIPLVSSLVGALFQIMRDHASHERTLLAMDHQNRFVLGASSHMANIAFDKHVEFCEEYVREANEALYTIFRHGPSGKVLEHAANLYRIQQKHAVWLTSKIEQDLEPFQAALRQMGASAEYVRETTGDPTAAQRQEHINRMYTILAKVTGSKEWDGKELTDELAVTSQIRQLRAILGTEELNEMRRALVTKAVSELHS